MIFCLISLTMKKLLFKISILFALPFLFSCEKEVVDPSEEAQALALVSESREASCQDFSYFHKYDGRVSLGNAWGKLVLVGFAEGVPLQAKKWLLSLHPQVDSIEGETFLYSGVLTIVRLKPNSTCFDATKLMKRLEKHPSVLFANPTFSTPSEDPAVDAWLGVSNEFLVSIEGSGTLAQLEQLVQKTNTKIVFSLSDEIHILSADKKAAGSVLEVVSQFNEQSFITLAEPNLLFQFSPSAASSDRASAARAFSDSKQRFLKKARR